jgi:hypothetical protein
LRKIEGGSFYKRENTFVLPEVEVDAASEISYMRWYREWVKLNSSSLRIPNNCHKPLQPQSHYTKPAFHVFHIPYQTCKSSYQVGSSDSKSPNNVVGKVTRQRAGHPGFESWQGQEVFLLQNLQTGCGPTLPPVRCVPGFLPWEKGAKCTGREVGQSPPYSAEVKSNTPAFPVCFHSVDMDSCNFVPLYQAVGSQVVLLKCASELLTDRQVLT